MVLFDRRLNVDRASHLAQESITSCEYFDHLAICPFSASVFVIRNRK